MDGAFTIKDDQRQYGRLFSAVHSGQPRGGRTNRKLKLAVTNLTGPLESDRPAVRPITLQVSPHIYKLFFCRLFSRWTREINPKAPGNVPSGVPR